ncbi:MAG: DUF4446 family protein [Oribacterium sp.]|nr:DUF4446 family protein [Oribacterium sp.]
MHAFISQHSTILLMLSFLFSIVSVIFSVYYSGAYHRLYRRYDFFMRGKDAETLENYIMNLEKHVVRLEDENEANKNSIKAITKNNRTAFQKIGLVRYNAFAGLGGNMSFALAILDYTNSGFVINSVHSQDGCYSYIKDVQAGTTEVELGAEEKLALERALGYKEKDE